jgi:hypothetical protein
MMMTATSNNNTKKKSGSKAKTMWEHSRNMDIRKQKKEWIEKRKHLYDADR